MINKFLNITLMLFIPFSLHAADDASDMMKDDRLSYALGYKAGKVFLQNPHVDYSIDEFIRGVKHGLENSPPSVSEEDMSSIIRQHQAFVIRKQEKQLQGLATRNLEEGNKFLSENAKSNQVKTSKSGLQYMVIKEGTGEKPLLSDMVEVNYIGKDIHEREIANTYSNRKPERFQMTALTKGWREALLMMKEGAKWRLFVPAELAYGERGAMPRIQPNAVLIFDIELLDVIKS